MQKWNVLNKIMEAGLVVVVRADDLEQAKRIAEACHKGGPPPLRSLTTVPGTKVIEELAAAYKPEDMIIGAGTVLDPETARVAILAGASTW